MDDSKRFTTPQEEIIFWRQTAERFKHDLEDGREELEEFQISSRELEAELETQLEQLENKNKELTSDRSKLQTENESLREKLEHIQSHSFRKQTELEDDLAQVTAYKDELQKYIRELEQSNDDLERTKRATVVSLEDFEQRLNQAIERNAFLENELDEKENLGDTVQRLKDEARDLRQELDVVTVKKPTVPKEHSLKEPESPDGTKSSLSPSPGSTANNTPTDGNKLVDSGYMGSQIMASTPSFKRLPSTSGGTPLTPSARISALNIVADLLRKVGALESKLASCRNFVKDQPRSGKPGGTGGSPSNSPRSDVLHGARLRAKRLNRGASVPPQQGVKIPV
ncbi:nuclear distribution protein nudE homolog 1-like isoform X1 [Mizuhopecten yessoensis]|uniref:nuclear distribution protein nudE homolog 1-like isoform X1 n=1 Tax=Mizuhopecten yessoensis TaxID=6573 RepID=UPI000B45F497|nr:nuclear distribution protein nudE homolog 1-like isoform X1 [Mizuhopecten yessoensis]